MDGELSGLAAVVTGGGSGIGLATARLLAAGARRSQCSTLNRAMSSLALRADVTDDASVRLAVDDCRRARLAASTSW